MSAPASGPAEELPFYVGGSGPMIGGLDWPLSGTDTTDDDTDFAELLQQWTVALIEHCQQRLQVAAEGPAALPDHPTP